MAWFTRFLWFWSGCFIVVRHSNFNPEYAGRYPEYLGVLRFCYGCTDAVQPSKCGSDFVLDGEG